MALPISNRRKYCSKFNGGVNQDKVYGNLCEFIRKLKMKIHSNVPYNWISLNNCQWTKRRNSFWQDIDSCFDRIIWNKCYLNLKIRRTWNFHQNALIFFLKIKEALQTFSLEGKRSFPSNVMKLEGEIDLKILIHRIQDYTGFSAFVDVTKLIRNTQPVQNIQSIDKYRFVVISSCCFTPSTVIRFSDIHFSLQLIYITEFEEFNDLTINV